jgi:hypothetical protein
MLGVHGSPRFADARESVTLNSHERQPKRGSVMDFKERFGLDYLLTRPSGPRSATPTDDVVLPQGLKDAVIAYGAKVMDFLNRAEKNKIRLFDLAKEMSARVDTLLPVMTFLVENGYVQRVEDPVGNDEFQLTGSGKSVAGNIARK